jgi:tRNA-Thr(GGU) m(6)t(6)A37 methyltransferase TsaA
MITVPLRIIGLVRTARRSPEDTPIQAALNRAEHGRIEIDPRYRDGLDGLDGFGYAWLLTWLHQPDRQSQGPPALKQTPFLLRGTGRLVGIFATRGPRRINPLGLSLIELIAVQELTVEFGGVDVVDGTPVVDLKPYVPRFDRPPGDPPAGWLDDISIADGLTPSKLEKRGNADQGPAPPPVS